MTRAPIGRSRSSSIEHNAIVAIDQPPGGRRSRIQLRRISEEKQRRCTFQKRKKGLLKKAGELSKMCDVKICLFSTGHVNPTLDEKSDVKFSWSVPNTTVDEIIGHYESTPQEQREKKRLDYVSHLELQIKKTEKESDNTRQLNSNVADEVQKKVFADYNSICAAKSRIENKIRELGGHPLAGMISDADQVMVCGPDVSANFYEIHGGNQVGLEVNHGPMPLAMSALPQYGPTNVELEDESKYNPTHEDQSGSEHVNPTGTVNVDNWDGWESNH